MTQFQYRPHNLTLGLMLPLLALLMILLCVVVFERAHVPQRDAEMSDGNRWSECQPV